MDFAQDQFKTHHHHHHNHNHHDLKPDNKSDNNNNNNKHHTHHHHNNYYRHNHNYHHNHHHNRIQYKRLFVGELLGTFVFVYLGQSALSSFELIGTQNDIINRQLATLLTLACAYLLATLLTINLTGAHLNPAYTLASATYGYIKWGRAFTYVSAQYLGSYLAAIFIHATYSDKLNQRHSEGLLVGMNATLRAHGNILSTGKLFTSYPPTEVSLTQLLISCTLASAVLMLLLIAIQESKLIETCRSTKPIFMAASLFLVQAAFMANGGPVLNPAQDFSPRLYIAMFGWGLSSFNLYHYNYWWMCGLVAPHLGALLGFALYQVLAHVYRIQEEEQTKSEQDYSLSRENEF